MIKVTFNSPKAMYKAITNYSKPMDFYCPDTNEVVFGGGATECINVAREDQANVIMAIREMVNDETCETYFGTEFAGYDSYDTEARAGVDLDGDEMTAEQYCEQNYQKEWLIADETLLDDETVNLVMEIKLPEECEEESTNLYNGERTCMRISLYDIKGTVVITDPCYVVEQDGAGANWSICNYGANMGTLGFKHSLVSTTIYGDGSGEVILSSPEISNNTEFGVDSGQIGVFLLEEILEHNPDFKKDYIEDRPWCAAVIPDFEGEVYIEIDYAPVDKDNLSDDDDEEEDYNEDELRLSIVGFGKNYNFKYRGDI